MADNTKEQQRAELHKAIWAIANDLRGSVDGWDFKQYVLGTLFYRYISENFANYINTLQAEAGVEDFDYATMDESEIDKETISLSHKRGGWHEKNFSIFTLDVDDGCFLFCWVQRSAR